MTDLLPLDPDQLLTTTRAVRKRLDLERPVPLEIVREAIEVAVQAPSGGNRQGWHWIVVTDPSLRAVIAEHYGRSYDTYRAARPATDDATARMASSSDHLRTVLADVPVHVIAAIETERDELPAGNQAGLWGSLLPAAWSLQLALRARGLGSAWTTLHLAYEREVADALGIPANVHQGVLLPVAYSKGTDFKSGPRVDLDAIIHVDRW
ncbi:MAG: nitroreductase family protein [Jatrophihabitans sp.]|uniref:nitroreductase family protein n=1 Tax=Jatrophihabitans sp. TaxID=1932789 RepID=UPI003F7EFB8D